jgi:FlaA1/EpsC-like NDP-sugar epimerase
MKKRVDLYSRTNQLLLGGCCFSASFAAAYLLRFEKSPAGADLQQLRLRLPILVAARLVAHSLSGIYRQVWKFVSLSDAIEIVKSISILSNGANAAPIFFPPLWPSPETVAPSYPRC